VLIILEYSHYRLSYYDSQWNFPFQILLRLQEAIHRCALWSAAPALFQLTPIYHPHQTDGHSCGTRVILVAQRGGAETFISSTELQAYRTGVLRRILNDTNPVGWTRLDDFDPFPLPGRAAAPVPARVRTRPPRRCTRVYPAAPPPPFPVEIPVHIPQWPGRHVCVAPSSIPGAGLGLYTARDIELGSTSWSNIICPYDGVVIPWELAHSPEYTSDYIWENTSGTLVIDAQDPHSCFGRYVNDHFDEEVCNCEIRELQGRAYVVALIDIPRGELFLAYDREYWLDKLYKIPHGPFRSAWCDRYNIQDSVEGPASLAHPLPPPTLDAGYRAPCPDRAVPTDTPFPPRR